MKFKNKKIKNSYQLTKSLYDPKSDLIGLLTNNPNLLGELNGSDWADLLIRHPQFADRCNWDCIWNSNWITLLRHQPQFADKCPWDKVNTLNDGQLSFLLDVQPKFIDRFNLGNFGRYDWFMMGISRSIKIDTNDYVRLCKHRPELFGCLSELIEQLGGNFYVQ